MLGVILVYVAFTVVFSFLLLRKVLVKKRLTAFDFFTVGVLMYYLVPLPVTFFLNEEKLGYRASYETLVGTMLIVIISYLIAFIAYKASVKWKLLYAWEIKLPVMFKTLIILVSSGIFMYVLWIYATKVDISNLEHNMQLRDLLFDLGPYAVLLQIPTGLALYFTYQAVRHKRNIFPAIFFMVVALMTSFIRGERTDLVFIALFPFLARYFVQKSSKPFVTGTVVILVILTLYSQNFKVTHVNEKSSLSETMVEVLSTDFDRNWVTWAAVDNTEFTHSKLLPYPGSGYVYTALAYVPRSIAPFKGYSAPTWFTWNISPTLGYRIVGTHDVGAMKSAYAFGYQVESILNFGYPGLLVVSVLVGLLIRFLQNLINRYNVLFPIIAIMCMQFSALTTFTLMTIHLPILVTAAVMYMSIKKQVKNTAPTLYPLPQLTVK
ncbi:hypothetical protein [Paenibacillus sp. GbtcB18]|uniref:hypothetical protein n=1 Tax=Paenibacillus sp. GbtcB18 TaxID=2824763 RepID=UPI001C2F6F83|nr:hypothetical protein [Paenibacillus sp. GbtcB18]